MYRVYGLGCRLEGAGFKAWNRSLIGDVQEVYSPINEESSRKNGN